MYAIRSYYEYGRSDLKNYLGYNANASPLRAVFHAKTADIDGLDEATRTALEEELTTALNEEVRITSYNVCYTKLLRWCLVCS